MAKYYFNKKTLQYEIVETSGRDRLLNFAKFFVLVSFLFVFIFKLTEDVVQSPKLKNLIADKNELRYEIELLNREVMVYHNAMEQIAYNDDHLYRVFFEVDAIPSTKRAAGTGGSQRYKNLENKPYSKLLKNSFFSIDEISRQLVIQSKSFDEVIDLAKNKEARMAAKPSIQPISLKDLIRFGSPFLSARMHPILKKIRPHEGIDLTARKGTNIYATADGVVKLSSYTTGGYGFRILLDHGHGYKTLYGHCSKLLVKKGDVVKRGEVIGLVGSSGLSKAPHLHYEVWVNNRPVDPINYYANDLAPDEFDRMINLLSKADPSFDIN